MRDYGNEFEKRVSFLKRQLESAGAKGFVYGNSGGKDSALVGILCKSACENTLGVIMPCQSSQNFGSDREDALKVAEQYGIETVLADLSGVKQKELEAVEAVIEVTDAAKTNIAPRLRMTTLYLIAQSRSALVVGTGNRSEAHMGYFTKWGDGAYDINPIGDLTVTEIYEFLRYLNAPDSIIEKAPSAGLFEGQTDEAEMGVSYKDIDRYLLAGEAEEEVLERIDAFHERSRHKRRMPVVYGE